MKLKQLIETSYDPFDNSAEDSAVGEQEAYYQYIQDVVIPEKFTPLNSLPSNSQLINPNTYDPATVSPQSIQVGSVRLVNDTSESFNVAFNRAQAPLVEFYKNIRSTFGDENYIDNDDIGYFIEIADELHKSATVTLTQLAEINQEWISELAKYSRDIDEIADASYIKSEYQQHIRR